MKKEEKTDKSMKKATKQIGAPPRFRRPRCSHCSLTRSVPHPPQQGAELRCIALLSLRTRRTAISGPPNKDAGTPSLILHNHTFGVQQGRADAQLPVLCIGENV